MTDRVSTAVPGSRGAFPSIFSSPKKPINSLPSTRPASQTTTRPSSKPIMGSSHPGTRKLSSLNQARSDVVDYLEIIKSQENRITKLLETLKAANLLTLISTEGSPSLSHAYTLQKLLNELTDSLDEAGHVERRFSETAHELHVMRTTNVQLEKRVETLVGENADLKRELAQIQDLLQSQTKHAAVELTMRRAEKLKSEKLAREVDTLHRCTAFLLSKKSGVELGDPERKSHMGLKKTLVELTRQNQQLYRKCVFATKQQILAELKLKAHEALVDGEGLSRFGDGLADVDQEKRALGREMESLPEYQPLCMQLGPSQVERDFLSFLQASRGLFSPVFLNELTPSQQQQCIEFLCREFAAFTDWDMKLRTLMEDVEKVNSLRDIDTAIQTITETIRKMTLCDRASIWVVDDLAKEAWTRKPVEIVTIAGPGPSMTSQEIRIGLGKGLVGVAYNTKKSVNIPDAYEDARFDRSVDMRTGYKTKSVICFPIVKYGKVVAIIQAINKAAGEAFTVQDEFVLRVFGTAAAETLGNCENTAVAEWFDYRRDLLVECARLLADRCRAPIELIRITKKTMNRLFRAVDVNILVVMEDHVLRILLDEDKNAVKTIECNLSLGYVGHVLDSRHPFSTVAPLDPTRHNLTSDLDLPVMTASEGRSALHTFPIMDGTKLRAVIQFIAPATRALLALGSSQMARSTTSKEGLNLPSDNGCFNEQNSRQVDVLNQFALLVLPYIRRFYPNVGIRKKLDNAKGRLAALGKIVL